MVTIGMNYQVLPGKEEVFERAFARVLDAMRQIAGHVDSHLYKDVHAPSAYLIVSEWSEKDRFDQFIASDAFAKVVSWGKEQVLSARPRHQVYTSG